jgi:hypothetical protein
MIEVCPAMHRAFFSLRNRQADWNRFGFALRTGILIIIVRLAGFVH